MEGVIEAEKRDVNEFKIREVFLSSMIIYVVILLLHFLVQSQDLFEFF